MLTIEEKSQIVILTCFPTGQTRLVYWKRSDGLMNQMQQHICGYLLAIDEGLYRASLVIHTD
jgi:hypothetical protein